MSNSLKVLNLYCLGRVTVLPSIGKSIFFLFQISGVLGKDLNTFFGNYIRNPCCLEPPNENCMKFASMYRNPRPSGYGIPSKYPKQKRELHPEFV